MYDTGTVTISLERYEYLTRCQQELVNVKQELENEKNKLWDMYGSALIQKKQIVVDFDAATISDVLYFSYRNPTTVMLIDEVVPLKDGMLHIVCQELIKRHIVDVIRSINFSALSARGN